MITGCRDFAQERFGWAKAQVDELIQPGINFNISYCS